MKATDLLKKQHKDVKALFKKVEKTGDAEGRRELMEQIGQMLALHTRLEEEIFYPAVRGLETRKAEAMIAEAFEEHHVVELVLKDLPNVDPEDERFEAKMTVLSELVEHHVEEEEGEMFKLAERLGKDELQRLGQQIEARMGGEMARGRRAA
jgi:hemerythrin superfamily protein